MTFLFTNEFTFQFKMLSIQLSLIKLYPENDLEHIPDELSINNNPFLHELQT